MAESAIIGCRSESLMQRAARRVVEAARLVVLSVAWCSRTVSGLHLKASSPHVVSCAAQPPCSHLRHRRHRSITRTRTSSSSYCVFFPLAVQVHTSPHTAHPVVCVGHHACSASPSPRSRSPLPQLPVSAPEYQCCSSPVEGTAPSSCVAVLLHRLPAPCGRDNNSSPLLYLHRRLRRPRPRRFYAQRSRADKDGQNW